MTEARVFLFGSSGTFVFLFLVNQPWSWVRIARYLPELYSEGILITITIDRGTIKRPTSRLTCLSIVLSQSSGDGLALLPYCSFST
jgi:ABC-type multidrug transport system permease subunit